MDRKNILDLTFYERGEVDITKILCLDQATKISGYSVFENKQLISYGTLESNAKEKNPIERMKQQYDLIKQLINQIKPDFICIENCQFQNNYNTYQQLSQFMGVVFVILFETNVPFSIIEPSAWKSYFGVRSRKRAEQKTETIQIVKAKYNLELSEDICDAIGIGYYAINHYLK